MSAEAAKAGPLPSFDFTSPAGQEGWQPTHDVASLQGSSDGLIIQINGDDPYIYGPPRDYPPGQPLWLKIRLKSDQQGMSQIFFFTDHPTEENSVRFPTPAGVWSDARVPLPELGPGTHLRFDPPGTGGSATLASISFEIRPILHLPKWPTPTPPDLSGPTLSLQAGGLRLIHSRRQWGGYRLDVDGLPTAAGFTRPLIGYQHAGQERWLDISRQARVSVIGEQDGIHVTVRAADPDGGAWEIRQQFRVQAPGAIAVETRVSVNQPRSVIFLPLLIVLPGLESFGASKGQGLFAGLEYLDNEPSSSTADLTVAAHNRQVPDSLKITIPLMAIQAHNRYVGLTWEKGPDFSALFDSPDRVFHSNGHLMGVLFPGSDPDSRPEGSLLPYAGKTLSPGRRLILHAVLLGGKGRSVVPAVQQYVALRGLPPVPNIGMDLQSYTSEAAAGWLDSGIRDGDHYRHAMPGQFQPNPTADAAVLMEWLAHETRDAALQQRLAEAAQRAIAAVPPENYNFASVSHVTYPMESLYYGSIEQNAEHALAAGRELLQRFEPDGSVLYHPLPGKPDYGKTHFARDANGLTAQVVRTLLEQAAVTGDPDLISRGIQKLRALDKFTNTVPRGAQTWEVPLHTPDILASAHLVRAYTLGYELTGDRHFLNQAVYWAWTGVPFVYLQPPTSHPIGLYATTAVLGATNWVAPVWMGLPVQWCGLVYADAVYRLARYNSSGPWLQIAAGITASGIQQSWPRAMGTSAGALRQGLLPDSFNLPGQLRNDPAINPGTVETNAVRFFHGPALYDFRALRKTGMLVHAPGAITGIQEQTGRAAFSVNAWWTGAYSVLVSGLKKAPYVRINGVGLRSGSTYRYVSNHGWLILTLHGKRRVEILTN